MHDFNKLKVFMYRIYFKLSKLSNKKTIQSIYGPVFKQNYKDSTFKYYILGSYGKYFSDFLREYSGEYCFIDIGANQGLYTLVAAKNNHCNKILAFEPVEYSYQILEENIKLNNTKSKVTLEKKAIFKKTEKIHMTLDLDHTGISSIKKYSGQNDGTLVEVDAIGHQELDEIFSKLTEHEIVVKIDVEGSEEIILGELLKTSIWGRVKYIFLEINNFPGYKDFILKNKFNEVYVGKGNVYDVMLKRHA